ncbi:MAG TPA: sulfotransferase domain-containing protein, partial [Anaerolineae bacterium]|nr:sulfotransferase domain-containing protein [Anaerolineae bacterium]
LQQHPQIFIGAIREPSFFAFEGEYPSISGPGYRGFRENIVTDLDTYKNLFRGANGARAIGERSNIYLYSSKARERIYHYLPDVKLVVILRNPVERAFSNYLMYVRDGLETLSFEQALQAEGQRMQEGWEYGWYYVQLGFYYRQLKPYYEIFDASQIRVFLYEEFDREPLRVLKEIFHFVGVEEGFMPDVSFRYNVSTAERKLQYRAPRRLFRTRPLRALRPYLPRALQEYMERRLLMQDRPKPTLAPEMRAYLLDLYREDIENLQHLIERDLSDWLA